MNLYISLPTIAPPGLYKDLENKFSSLPDRLGNLMIEDVFADDYIDLVVCVEMAKIVGWSSYLIIV